MDRLPREQGPAADCHRSPPGPPGPAPPPRRAAWRRPERLRRHALRLRQRRERPRALARASEPLTGPTGRPTPLAQGPDLARPNHGTRDKATTSHAEASKRQQRRRR